MNLKPEKKLGFGLMRLPVLEDKSIDLEAVCPMVDALLEAGFTYFDTAYPYHGGASESAVRKVLVERHPRESYTLATKLPGWLLSETVSAQQLFDEQLEKTGAGYFDHYLLHSVNRGNIEKYDSFDCWNWGLGLKAAGKIRWFGFSFHDTPEMLDELLSKHEVDFVQLQINYLDWENEAVQSRGCYEVATKHGVPVVVMEPVKGGTLATMPEAAADILKAHSPAASLASWAIRYAASLPNVMTVLSGMSNQEQIEDNVATMKDFVPLNEAEYAVLQQATDKLVELKMIPCTACRYCVDDCPMSIQIPDIIRCLNHTKVYGRSGDMKKKYAQLAEAGSPASACIGCGQCEGVCPQHLEVPKIMEEAAALYEEQK